LKKTKLNFRSEEIKNKKKNINRRRSIREETIGMESVTVVVQQQTSTRVDQDGGVVTMTEYQLYIRGLFDSHFNFFRGLRPTLREAPSEGLYGFLKLEFFSILCCFGRLIDRS